MAPKKSESGSSKVKKNSSKPKLNGKKNKTTSTVGKPIESFINEKERYTEAYLFCPHPGLSIKERPLAVKNVTEILGERKDEYGLGTEYLLIGDDLKGPQWVSSFNFHAPQKIEEFQQKSLKQLNETTQQNPLNFKSLMRRNNRLIPIQNVVPSSILYSFTQELNGKKQEFYMVKDDQDKNIIMLQDVVKTEFPQLYMRYITTFFGFEIAQ